MISVPVGVADIYAILDDALARLGITAFHAN